MSDHYVQQENYICNERGKYRIRQRACQHRQQLCVLTGVFAEYNSTSMVEALIKDVAEAHVRLLDTVRRVPATTCEVKPGDNTTWCINEVLEHLVLSEQYMTGKLWASLAAAEHGQRFGHEAKYPGLDIKDVIAQAWCVRETAPTLLTPRHTYEHRRSPSGATPNGAPKEFWIACLQSCGPVLRALGYKFFDRYLDQVVFPHLTLGPLDAKQHLQFLSFHIDHHTRQIHRIITSLSGWKSLLPLDHPDSDLGPSGIHLDCHNSGIPEDNSEPIG